MPSKFTLLSAAEQAANHLRGQVLSGVWGDEMPGAPKLAAELGVDHKTVITALHQLEHEDLLVPQGPGRRRRITLPEEIDSPSQRVAILAYEPRDELVGYLNELEHLLSEAGHTPFFTSKCLTAMNMDVQQIARMVEQTPADAWVVSAGSHEVLSWFAEQEVPAFALFGRHSSFPIAAARPDKVPAYRSVVRRLDELGHSRIVLLARKERRRPEPGKSESAFLEELETYGFPASSYNLPDWEESTAGYHQVLDELFKHTPPTALIVQEGPFVTAVLQFCSSNGMRVPQDLSLVCTDADGSFAWCQPSIAHIRWDYRPVIRRIVRWANNVARGKDDRRQTLTKAEFVEGGTVGRAP